MAPLQKTSTRRGFVISLKLIPREAQKKGDGEGNGGKP